MLEKRSFSIMTLTVLQVSMRGLFARKASWLGVLIFSVCVLILFPFSFGTELVKQESVRLGCYWIIQEFVVVLLISRLFSVETEHGAMELFLSPGFSRAALFCGKVAFSFVQLCTLQIPITVIWLGLYGVPEEMMRGQLQLLVPVLALFNLGTSCLGVILHGFTARSLGKEILLPILFFPLQLSVLLAAVQLSLQDQLLLPKGGLTSSAWWSILGGFPVIFGALGLLLQNALFEE